MKPQDLRDETMKSMFLDGETLQAIGDAFGVTRERVRQILKRQGLARSDGGRHQRFAERRAEVQARYAMNRDARAQKTYGCSHADLIEANEGKSPRHVGSFAHRYQSQKGTAACRGIAWRISLPEWKAIWVLSGHWEDRGQGGYVMARVGDAGPYAIWNVHICTSSENIKEGYVFRARRKSAA